MIGAIGYGVVMCNYLDIDMVYVGSECIICDS